jgi:SAM-dependent methyltransferase
MHRKFLDILCCPHSGTALRLESEKVRADGMVEAGVLVSAKEDYRYPIINCIPRFLDQEGYTESFGYEWERWSRVQFDSENIGRPMSGHTENMFNAVTGFSADFLSGKTIVEFGCGPGRFIDVVRRRGGIAVGIDMSAAVESARRNFAGDTNVLIVQGDILNPPFRDRSFDAGYSIGVFHHTPNPGGALKELVRVVKDHGAVACCVYPKMGLYNSRAVARFRTAHKKLKKLFGNSLATAYSYLSAYVLHPIFVRARKHPRGDRLIDYLEEDFLVNVYIPDAKWRVLDVFDAITPEFASTHTAQEVESWFANSNCRNVTARPWGPTAFVGIKGG